MSRTVTVRATTTRTSAKRKRAASPQRSGAKGNPIGVDDASQPTPPANTAGLVETWYAANGRDLPWRGSEVTPYGVWVSEIMLQQTRVDTVKNYYARWMQEFPTIRSLSASNEERVKELWSGLGYYRRAGYLLKGAKFVQSEHKGKLPVDCLKSLLKVPGIGDYTAGAIASITGGLSVPSVDGNHIRVVSRYLAVRDCQPSNAQSIKQIRGLCAEILKGSKSPGAFNQGLMDIGATICTSTSPDCGSCPLSSQCGAYALKQSGDVEDIEGVFPLAKQKAKSRDETWHVAVLTAGQHVLMTKREGTGLLAGMYQCPNVVSPATAAQQSAEKRRKVGGGDSTPSAGLVAHLVKNFKLSRAKRGGAARLPPARSAGEAVHKFSHINATMVVSVFCFDSVEDLQAAADRAPSALEAVLLPLGDLVKKGKDNETAQLKAVSEQMRKAIRKAADLLEADESTEEEEEEEDEDEDDDSE